MKSPRPTSRRGRAAFTLVEVMVASLVLVFGIVTALSVLQRGNQAFDTARNLALASQLMQGEMERLRLMSWAQLDALQQSGDTAVPLDANTGAVRARFQCARVIADIKTNMKEITLTATWSGYDGRPHTARLITRYGRTGLNDYFYTAH